MCLPSLPWGVTLGSQPPSRPLVISNPARTPQEQREDTKPGFFLCPAVPDTFWSPLPPRQAPGSLSTEHPWSQVVLAPCSPALRQPQTPTARDLPQRTPSFSLGTRASWALLGQVPMAVGIPTGAVALEEFLLRPAAPRSQNPASPTGGSRGCLNPARASSAPQPLQDQAGFEQPVFVKFGLNNWSLLNMNLTVTGTRL